MNTKELAKKVRIHTLEMTSVGGSSHIGSIFSIVDILAVLYGKVLKIRPEDPKWINRDRFILSKGHAGAAVYAVLAEVGFFNPEKLKTHYQDGSDLSGHVSHKGIPGVELSTGSLGHGLGVGLGMAKAAKLDRRDNRVVILLSDGECDEGSNWEAILFAAHHKLDNILVIIDYNKLQSLGSVSSTLNLEPFRNKWEAFGWTVIEIDGHNHEEIAKACSTESGSPFMPTCIIAHTIKGKGVSFMENQVLWHYRTAKNSEFDDAMKELKESM